MSIKRLTIPELVAYKGHEVIVTLTAYTAPMAGLLDPHADILLVGDSLGMVVYGFDSTLPVTLDMMGAHGAAVVRGSQRASVVIDMPFGSYQESPAQAFANAARLLVETGAGAVKLEGGKEMATTIRFLVERGIPVMGHVGLTPQSVHTLGGYRARGRTKAEAAKIREDALAVAEAGAFSVVLENIVSTLADAITASLSIPTIGIGASAACDGQVLVIDDMLGITQRVPPFVKRYAGLAETIGIAASTYAAEVRQRSFPSVDHIVKDH